MLTSLIDHVTHIINLHGCTKRFVYAGYVPRIKDGRRSFLSFFTWPDHPTKSTAEACLGVRACMPDSRRPVKADAACLLFLDYTVQLRHSQRTHTHTPKNTRTQTLPLWASSNTEPANSRDWRSHHRRLAGNVPEHRLPLNAQCH